MPDNSLDAAIEQPQFNVGDAIWTYSRRFSENPVLVQGVVLESFSIEGHYPPIKYIIAQNSVLCVRDSYTMAYEAKDIPVHINLDMSNALSDTTFREQTYDD